MGRTAAAAPDDRTLVLSRHFAAPPERVWAAWTDPAVLPRWFGPEGFHCVTHEIDIRVGGQWIFDMIGHGMTFPNRHRYLELTPHSRIHFLMDGNGDSGEPKDVTVTLTPRDGGTDLRQVMVFPSVAEKEEAESYHAVELGQTTLAKLAAALGE
ncbi:MAG: hypothetical protein GC146_15105 [Limimaricola sp.]|uniref:SRPBCC domain-containing protein n=1 Tax=Limimaricola sp. TaxID=2211665 RepID=UPI001D3E6AD6|nr:SRPBCC domain-containing protein [Limimaricola sp.]MBI1418543.1 hypothetical protein [Limimaricola sp.]